MRRVPSQRQEYELQATDQAARIASDAPRAASSEIFRPSSYCRRAVACWSAATGFRTATARLAIAVHAAAPRVHAGFRAVAEPLPSRPRAEPTAGALHAGAAARAVTALGLLGNGAE